MAGHCWKCRIMPVRISENGTTTPARNRDGDRVRRRSRREDHQRQLRASKLRLGRGGRGSGTPPSVVPSSSRRRETRATTSRSIQPRTRACSRSARRDMEDALYFWSSRGPWVLLTAPGCHMVVDLWYPPGTLCGTSFTPSAVAGVLGRPLVTQSEPQPRAGAVGRARGPPGRSLGSPTGGSIPWQRSGGSACRSWTTYTPAAAPPNPTPRPAPGQRFTRQTIFETGTFKRGFRSTFRVGRGRIEMQLLTPLASACSLSLSKAGELTVAAPAVKNLISLSIRVTAGRYTAEVQCRGARTRQYSLGVIAMFPRGFP